MNKRQHLINLVSDIPNVKLPRVYEEILPILEENQAKSLRNQETVVIACCPHCGSVSIKKNGTKNGRQRYYCNDCHRSFSVTTNTFLSHSRISESKWIDFLNYEITGMSLKEESFYLGVSLQTCFRMRHKLYAAVTEIEEKNKKLSGMVQLDCAYRKINLKGTRPENMPRISKKRGNGSAYSGISHHKICIASAIDQNDHMFLKVVGLGHENFEKYWKCRPFLEDVNIIVSDSNASVQLFANDIGAISDSIPTRPDKKKNYVTKAGRHLGEVNELDSEITCLITRAHGVGTRYFQGYLNFITFKKNTKYKNERNTMAEAMFEEIKQTNAYKEADLFFKELPISLQDAYYEYRYGIFADSNT